MTEQTLKQRITGDMKSAMRAKQKERLSAIRLILAELKRIEVDERIELDDARVLATLDKMCKQRRDSITQYRDADRPELAEIEEQELEVIQEYLPSQLSDAELTELVGSAIAQTNASSMQDMGKVMAILKPQVAGRADMGNLSKLVKQLLNA